MKIYSSYQALQGGCIEANDVESSTGHSLVSGLLGTSSTTTDTSVAAKLWPAFMK